MKAITSGQETGAERAAIDLVAILREQMARNGYPVPDQVAENVLGAVLAAQINHFEYLTTIGETPISKVAAEQQRHAHGWAEHVHRHLPRETWSTPARLVRNYLLDIRWALVTEDDS